MPGHDPIGLGGKIFTGNHGVVTTKYGGFPVNIFPETHPSHRCLSGALLPPMSLRDRASYGGLGRGGLPSNVYMLGLNHVKS